MRRPLAVLFALILPAGALCAQSLAELAEDAKKKRKKATPVYTDDDLKKHSPAGSASPAPGQASAPRGGAERGVSSGGDGGEGGSGDEGAGPGGGSRDESYWREQAASLERAVESAEQRVAAAQSRLNALVVDAVPTNVADPFRLETLEAEKVKARQELEDAERELERAEDAIDAFEEDARRKGVPPGWLREP